MQAINKIRFVGFCSWNAASRRARNALCTNIDLIFYLCWYVCTCMRSTRREREKGGRERVQVNITDSVPSFVVWGQTPSDDFDAGDAHTAVALICTRDRRVGVFLRHRCYYHRQENAGRRP
ncbi:hypothetical protein Trydic_g17771 [Trypoxylus dichotomus]